MKRALRTLTALIVLLAASQAQAQFGGSRSAPSATDNTPFTGGTDKVATIGALYDTTPPAITDGNIGAPRMDANRILFGHLVDSAGVSTTDSTYNAQRVTPVTGTAITGQSGPSAAAYFVNCVNSVSARVTTANTFQVLAAATGGTKYYFCTLVFKTTAANSITWKEGTQTSAPCDTNTGTLWAQTDYEAGQGAVIAPGIGGYALKTVTADRQVCLTTSAATPFTYYGTYGNL